MREFRDRPDAAIGVDAGEHRHLSRAGFEGIWASHDFLFLLKLSRHGLQTG